MWTEIAADSLPPDQQFVLLACPSGYITTPWVYVTGRVYLAYRGRRFIDEGNDDLLDRGLRPTHWRKLPTPPIARATQPLPPPNEE